MERLLGNLKNKKFSCPQNKILYGKKFNFSEINKVDPVERTTYDLKEKMFFNDLHLKWWGGKEGNCYSDQLGKIIGSGLHSLHDYNKRRFNFIFKTYEFMHFEKLKNEKMFNKKSKENEVLRILDIGCGGGILCEYIRKNLYQFLVNSNILFQNKNMEVKKWDVHIDGIDVSENLIDLANFRLKEHEKYNIMDYDKIKMYEKKDDHFNISLNYKNCDISDLVNEYYEKSALKESYNNSKDKQKGKEIICDKNIENKYDIIISSEVIEHIPNEKKERFIKYISQLSKDNTIVVFTTINKNILSYLYTIVLAEYLTGMIPRGTHEYEKFIDDLKLSTLCSSYNMAHLKTDNVVYVPILRNYFTTHTLKLLYLSAFVHKPR